MSALQAWTCQKSWTKLFDEIVDVFVKKQVVVFRDQHIEPQHQVAFSQRFGPFEMLYDEDQRVPGFPEKQEKSALSRP